MYMNYILLISLFVSLIFVFFLKKTREHFSSIPPLDKKEGDAIIDILKDIEINLDDYEDKNGKINFDNLPQNIINDSKIDSVLNNLDTEIESAENKNIKYVKKAELKVDSTKRYIFKAKLFRDEILKRILEKNNKEKLQMLKEQNKILEKYSRDEIPSTINKCYVSQHPYNISGSFDKYSLDYTLHPMKWYGLDTNFTNAFPYNYVHV